MRQKYTQKQLVFAILLESNRFLAAHEFGKARDGEEMRMVRVGKREYWVSGNAERRISDLFKFFKFLYGDENPLKRRLVEGKFGVPEYHYAIDRLAILSVDLPAVYEDILKEKLQEKRGKRFENGLTKLGEEIAALQVT